MSSEKKYKKLLDIAFEKAKTDRDWASDVVPELLKLGILEKEEINVDMPRNITIMGTIFFENFKDQITIEDVEFIERCHEIFTYKEMNYLYAQDYTIFKEVKDSSENGKYAEIWNIKRNSYPEEEKNKLQEMEKYFGVGIWTYFMDKVHGDKKLINRFRDPHNALLHYDKIIQLAKELETKGISKEEFIKNYLGIAGDRNNGYQQLNNFLEKYNFNWNYMVNQSMSMDEFKNNQDFINLANTILEKDKTGELYKNLDELEQVLTVLQMLKNKESLIKIQRLVDSDNPDDKKLYEYYKSAIYHPRTKPIIMKMYDNPEEFLGLDDTTSSDINAIHQAKKPSHMVTDFEYLDFDAGDLVNCLPLGVYDKLSYFKPFEMKFYINGNTVYTKSEIQEKITNFLKVADPKKISVIITKLKKQGDDTMWFQIWKEDKENFISKIIEKYDEKKLISLFIELGYSEFNKFRDLKEMTAKISPKSDPNNRFNGFNCDSLVEGHGKKVVAMFNPYCTDFCIYEGDQDPKEDNLKVTSWVTLNREIPENFNTLLGKIKNNTTHDIVTVLGDKFEDYKDPKEYVITMDNIEENPNFGNKYAGSVRQIYEKFFSEYIKQNPISPNGIPINTSKFYSGVNYNKLAILNKKVLNQSLPVFVNSYTDNSSDYSLQGDLDAGEQKEKIKKTGIQPLSIEDVVQISYLEGKIYPSSMKDHLGNLQHEITASILNNTLKDRPNLSFAWYNDEGKIGGYILAYQGKMSDGTPGIYISDFAMLERGQGGIKMINNWMKEVKTKYPNMPIFTRARENTSYRMVKVLAEKKGYHIIQDDLIQDAGENRHRVVMKPKN